MQSTWILDLAYASNMEVTDEDIYDIVQADCQSSGFGFGERDMQFEFATQQEAEAAKQRILADKVLADQMSYITVYQDEDE